MPDFVGRNFQRLPVTTTFRLVITWGKEISLSYEWFFCFQLNNLIQHFICLLLMLQVNYIPKNFYIDEVVFD